MTPYQIQARNQIISELRFKAPYWDVIKFNIRLFVSERMKEQQ